MAAKTTKKPAARHALKLSKDTLKDLAVRSKATKVKGGLTTKCPKGGDGGSGTVLVA